MTDFALDTHVRRMPDRVVEDRNDSPPEEPVEVPYQQLPPETLQRMIEDIVTRDGTDYGAVERTLEQKAAALMRQLERGEAKLVIDLATETISVLTSTELARSLRAQRGKEPSES